MVVSSVIIECCKLCPSYCRLPSADRIEYLFPSLPWYLDPGPALLSMTGLGCSKTDNYPVLKRVKLLPILRKIRKQYHTRNVSQQYLVICNGAYINLVSLLAFNLLIYNLWSRKELEIDTILPQFPAGPKDILAQKLHSFQLMLNENKQKVFFKTISLFRRGGYFCQHWNNIKTECLLLSTLRHALGVGEGQPANL